MGMIVIFKNWFRAKQLGLQMGLNVNKIKCELIIIEEDMALVLYPQLMMPTS